MTSRAPSARAAKACAPAFRALLPSVPDQGLFGPSADASCIEVGYCGKALPVNGGPERPDGARRNCRVGRPMKYRCAILDDYQNVALSYADWSKIAGDVEVKVFNQASKNKEEVRRAVQGVQSIAMMRERTAFLRDTIEALPDLKLLITTGAGNKSIDLTAAARRGVTLAGTRTFGNPTTGIAFGLILELTRRIGFEKARMKAGAPWQGKGGEDIEGET